MGDRENPSRQLVVQVYDGTRRLIGKDVEIGIDIHDGNRKDWTPSKSFKGPVHSFSVEFFNTPIGDRYSVIVSANRYKTAGCYVYLKVSKQSSDAKVMLLPTKGTFKFPDGDWDSLRQNRRTLYALLRQGATSDEAARERYGKLMQDNASTLAAIMNITEALDQIPLPPGPTALDYFKQLIWDDTMQRDRFYAYADISLKDQLEKDKERFTQEPNPGAWHEGATVSYKQVEFEQGNVQISFHENAPKLRIDDKDCVKAEPDIDYYRDLIAHGLGEVVPNHITKGLTNPEKVYLLRWIAGQQALMPEFDPPFVIA
jgi:hypothetical protein